MSVRELKPLVPAKIVGYAVGLPKPEMHLDNVAIGRVLEAEGIDRPEEGWDKWIERRNGIKNRYFAGKETVGTLAVKAGLAALEKAGLEPTDIDVCLVGTSTAENQVPVSVHEIQDTIGFRKSFCADIGMACAGFVHGSVLANAMLAIGAKRAMVIGVDTVDKVVSPSDQDSLTVFASGGGAVIYERSDDKNFDGGMLAWTADNKGEFRHLMTIPHGGTMEMHGTELANEVIRMAVDLGDTALNDVDMEKKEVAWFIMHQPGKKIMRLAARRLKIPWEKIGYTVDRFGNTSAGTVPLTYAMMADEGYFSDGDILMFNSQGVGLGGSCFLWRYRE